MTMNETPADESNLEKVFGRMMDDRINRVSGVSGNTPDPRDAIAKILELAKDADLGCEKLAIGWCGECGSCNLCRYLTELAAVDVGNTQPEYAQVGWGYNAKTTNGEVWFGWNLSEWSERPNRDWQPVFVRGSPSPNEETL